MPQKSRFIWLLNYHLFIKIIFEQQQKKLKQKKISNLNQQVKKNLDTSLL